MADMYGFAILLIISMGLKRMIDTFVPYPYMDEIFHVPQAQRFWNGNFTHDPKITTLPGLYFASNAILKGLAELGISSKECTVGSLRLFNTLMIMTSYNIFHAHISDRYDENLSKTNRAFAALTLTLFPLHFFFGFIYYTDVLSTLLVLSMFLYARYEHDWIAAGFGAAAIFTRQTNVIWLGLQVMIIVWKVFEESGLDVLSGKSNQPKKQEKQSSNKKKKLAKKKSERLVNMPSPKRLFRVWRECCIKALSKACGYGVVIVLFLIFVVVNGGIAVGDKDAHQASINLPQVIYFGLFSGVFMAPVLFTFKAQIIKSIAIHPLTYILACIVGLLAVHFNTVVHPYILADNRHYTFYIWKRLFQLYPQVKYFLVPLSMSSWFAIFSQIRRHPAIKFALISCIAAVLIPQRLFEFRYFILPYFILRLEMNAECFRWKSLIPEVLVYIGINAITIYLFLYKPFRWPDSNDVQRFMW